MQTMKNELFNIRRFGYLCRKEWMETWGKNWKIRIAAPVLILTLLMCWNYWDHCQTMRSGKLDNFVRAANVDLLLMAFWFFLIYAICMTGTVMYRVAERKSRIQWLLTPASALEKFLIALLEVLVVFFILFPLALGIEEIIRVGVFSVLYPDLPVRFVDFSSIIGDGVNKGWSMCGNMHQFLWGMEIGFFFFSIFVLGATIWPKNAVIRTLAALVLLGVVYYGFIYGVMWMLFPENMHSLAALQIPLVRNGDRFSYFYNYTLWGISWGIYWRIPVALFFLILAYFRFKEMEIINRW